MENIWGFLFDGISGKILSGILGISLIWTFLSFFVPLNIYVEAASILFGLLFFFKHKLYQEFYQFSKKDFALLGISSMIIMFAGSFYPYILDHFGYYIPTLKWLTEYGLVKGISNIDLTLGQMSIWHIFQAGFSNFSDPFLRINTILLIIYSIYTIERKSWIHLCFIPVLLLFSQSPSPDLPVIIFSLIILNEIITGNRNTKLLFAFSVFVFAIKPTMIWLPILTFLSSFFIFRNNFRPLFLGSIILVLFFMKNIWVFGYPVFPVAIGDLGVSWKPNTEVLKISSQFAIMKTYDMQYTYEEIQKFSTSDYIKSWFSLEGIKSKINILFVLSLVIFIAFAWIKKKKLITLICISLLIKSILVLVFSAQYRFFIDVFFVIFFVLFYEYFDRKKSIAIFSALSLLCISILSLPEFIQRYIPSFRVGSFMTGIDKKQLYKPSTYEYHQFNTFKVGNFKFNISHHYPYSFDTPIPAVNPNYIFDYVEAGIFPQLSDKNDLKKGFIWKKMTSEEKKEAQKVINNIKNTDK
ncbi:LIC_10190 family membrane protein [Chryseobacterium sp. 'Rf worker isolate 10']|uniref:LIC_10190 family membrane protein n=1 Tax=Chryseobacterium sp. 'Rf worker isolate 10' TaxID=2887348 RepID=UPI003D6DCD29